MKNIRSSIHRIRTLLWVLLLSAGLVVSVHADPPPGVPARPPLAPPPPDTGTPDASPALSAADLPPLKAVLIVGPIDGDNGSWTTKEKNNMELAAAELEKNGVTVHRFYTPNNDWGQIAAAAQGAHFLLYRGHGVYWSTPPHPTVGGFSLKGGLISSDQIRADLELAPNAIVMLYGCFTAGSSSTDQVTITSAEAQRRVAQYSDPFFDLGAAGYYANWFGDAFQKFVQYLFAGHTLGDAYASFYDYGDSTVERYTHPDHPAQAMWLDKDYWSGQWKYNNAFAGQPDRTLADLIQTSMELSTHELHYLSEPTFAPRTYGVSVNSTTPESFAWTAAVAPGELPWLDVAPESGSSGNEINVILDPSLLALGTYQAEVRVQAGAPDVGDGDQTVTVVMHVVDQVHQIYLPLVLRDTR